MPCIQFLLSPDMAFYLTSATSLSVDCETGVVKVKRKEWFFGYLTDDIYCFFNSV